MRILTKSAILLLLISFWLTPLTNANYQDTETSIGNSFTAGCWSAPSIPVHQTPADNDYFNGPTPTFDWVESSFICPNATAQYQFQVFTDSGLNNLYHQSGWLSSSEYNLAGMPDGDYWWQVRSEDSQGYQSSWSTAWKLTIDRVAPSTILDTSGFDIEESITNPSFESGLAGWSYEGEVNIITSDFHEVGNGTNILRLGTPEIDAGDETGNPVWTNKISQRLTPGAKNLSFMYNLYSFDSVGSDEPAMYVKLNDYAVYSLTAWDIALGGYPNQTGWQQLSFDLTGLNEPVLEIIFYSGNTGDEYNQSWLYLDNITTAEAQVNDLSNFNLTSTDSLSGVALTEYSLDGINFDPYLAPFSANLLLDGFNTIYFQATDNAGNQELTKERIIKKNDLAPEAIDLFSAVGLSEHSVTLGWVSPADDDGLGDTVSRYDIRYSLTDITDDTDFYNASSIKVANPPAPFPPGEDQYFTVTGLNPGETYYFAIKSADAVSNWSDISNTLSADTLTQVLDSDNDYGDVVINELMWMGTTGSTADEYLELRNLTNRDIDISGWIIQGAGFAGGDLTLPLGSTILAQGYFLITNFSPTDSSSSLQDTNVISDWVTTSLTLINSDAQYTLTDDINFIIDEADDGDGLPFAGDATLYYSMERNTTPGDGTQASSWHTIFDNSAETLAYWDNGGPEKGTPGGRNLSQTTPLKSLKIYLNKDQPKIGFKLIDPDLSKFDSLEYILTYDSLSGTQGIRGSREIKDQAESIEVQGLVLGTCSTNGDCLYHQSVQNFSLKVILKGLIERTYETNL